MSHRNRVARIISTMRNWRSGSSISLSFMAAVLVLLPVLAILQYRWIGQVSQAERERMQANLLKMTSRFGEDFDRELNRELMNASVPFQKALEVPPENFSQEYARQYARWRASSQYPNLFRRGCLAETRTGGEYTLSCFDPRTSRFEQVDWPEDLASIHERLSRAGSGRMPFRGGAEDDPGVILSPLVLPPSRPAGWGQGPPPRMFPRITRWSITQINMDFLEKEFLPGMIRTHFGQAEGLDYDVDVVSRRNPGVVLYRSDPKRALTLPLGGGRGGEYFRSPSRAFDEIRNG